MCLGGLLACFPPGAPGVAREPCDLAGRPTPLPRVAERCDGGPRHGRMRMVAYRHAAYDTLWRARPSSRDGRFHRAGVDTVQYLSVHPLGPAAEVLRTTWDRLAIRTASSSTCGRPPWTSTTWCGRFPSTAARSTASRLTSWSATHTHRRSVWPTGVGPAERKASSSRPRPCRRPTAWFCSGCGCSTLPVEAGQPGEGCDGPPQRRRAPTQRGPLHGSLVRRTTSASGAVEGEGVAPAARPPPPGPLVELAVQRDPFTHEGNRALPPAR